MTGKIKYCNSYGYGFIDTPNKIDFWFHHTAYNGDWKDLLRRYVGGEKIEVEFDNDTTATRGPRAINIRNVKCQTSMSELSVEDVEK